MSIPILGEIERFINEHGSSVVLREHLDLLRTKLQILKEDVENLQKENADLITRNAELEQQISRQKTADEFEESRGTLFKRLPSGSYSETPYCPICNRPMSCFRHMFPYECANKSCNHVADFMGSQLLNVMSELP